MKDIIKKSVLIVNLEGFNGLKNRIMLNFFIIIGITSIMPIIIPKIIVKIILLILYTSYLKINYITLREASI